MDQILTVVAAVEGSGEEIKTNSLEVRTDSSEVEEVVEDADEEVLEDKILTKDSVDAAVEGSVEEIEDSGEALGEENLVDGEALEDVEDMMEVLEEEDAVGLEGQECGWMKVDLEDHLEDLEVPWMDRWMVLLDNNLGKDQTTILTTVVAVEDVAEEVPGRTEDGEAEAEVSSELEVPWTDHLDQTVQWKIHLMDLLETWRNLEKERRSKVKRKQRRETGKEGRVDGETRTKVC